MIDFIIAGVSFINESRQILIEKGLPSRQTKYDIVSVGIFHFKAFELAEYYFRKCH
jgi:hypothetical protein